ncbi:Hypothetical protein NTJ_11057 [Nesidiocoris tenuis]|uniref:Uncharacterized protein n=1 Tax=Nesidiocoris tenuis TaxID=355587 RepID=A0ABN7B650_9HEMI|nr:Hypothetical protein NTJ_11057 [Nesidiocoris tenuis]
MIISPQHANLPHLAATPTARIPFFKACGPLNYHQLVTVLTDICPLFPITYTPAVEHQLGNLDQVISQLSLPTLERPNSIKSGHHPPHSLKCFFLQNDPLTCSPHISRLLEN